MIPFDERAPELVGSRIVSVSADRMTLALDDGRSVSVTDPYAVRVDDEA